MIGRGVLEERCLKVKELMSRKGIDALYLTPSADMYYLTGFWSAPSERMILCVIPKSGEPLFIVPKMYEEQVEATSWIRNVEVWKEGVREEVQLRNLIKRFGLPTGKIAVPERIWMKHFNTLRDAIPEAKYVFTSKILGQMRIVKSEDEIKLMERAAELAVRGLDAAIPEVKQGKREVELAAQVEYWMRMGGSEGPAFETIVASGPNSALPHYGCGSRIICEGDTVTFDVGALYGRYCSDLTRTIIVGEAKPKMMEIYNTVYRAHQEALRAVKPGVAAGTVDYAARKIIVKEGYGKYFIHRTGHGVGLDIHEPPYIHRRSKTILKPGMAFTIEPGIYIPGEFGVRIEDTVVVTGNGFRILTEYPREMAYL
ncbi:MAG: M24 family metallopeptidase [Candidatus Bathyarchaeia archaeon]